jgi:diaminohydroxyphosphoribosylaminopyrimidine deaminase/5-amino-6-(5-phosphoribosylamino)uracil reductase
MSFQSAKKWMEIAFAEALISVGNTLPNPPVGALVVHGDQLIARGRTQKAGQNHAEVEALNQAGAAAQGADLFVTLEPCSHFGRTPPCTDAIIRAGIRRVFISILDPNPRVNGQGIRKLQEAGIECHCEIHKEYGNSFYAGFKCLILNQRPYFYLKTAQTLNSCIALANKMPLAISSPQAQRHTHQLRARSTAIMIGAQTLLFDNPRLDVRQSPGNNPQKIVLGRHVVLNEGLHLLKSSEPPIWVYAETLVGANENVLFFPLPPGNSFKNNMKLIASELENKGHQQVLVECGASLLNLFLDSGCWDYLEMQTSPRFLESPGLDWRLSSGLRWAESLILSKFEPAGADLICGFENKAPWNEV